MKLNFYTTVGCHLCEQGAEIVMGLKQTRALEITFIDIADDENLVEQYGIRIPVIKKENAESDLGWPFDLTTLETYLDT